MRIAPFPRRPSLDGAALIERFRGRFLSLRFWLESSSFPYHIAGITFLVLLPTLGSGLIVDDVLHRLIATETVGVPIGQFDIFNLISLRPEVRARFLELGLYDWWIGPDTTVRYFRPLAALTHVVDYTWWPHAAWLMHLENLAWYAAVVVASAAFYRRFIRRGWIANRNALMSVLFGVLSLLAHDRWRRDRRRAFAMLGPLALLLALSSAEAGVAIVGYVFAYAFFIDEGSLARRAASLAPYVAVTLVWRLVYVKLGYGIAGSGIAFDPVTDTGAFLRAAVSSTPLLIASDVVGIPADLLIAKSQLMGVAALAATVLLGILACALSPLLQRDSTTRFFAAGALMSAAPLGATFPSDRYLFWVGLGIMGLIAQLVGSLVRSPGFAPIDGGGRLVCAACIFFRGLISPMAFPLRAAGPGLLHDEYEHAAATLPDGPGASRQTIVLVNSPFDLISAFLPIIRMVKGGPVPEHFYTLYSGAESVSIARTGEKAIEVTSTRGWLADVTDRTFRRAPFRAGDTVSLARMTADVRGVTSDGRPNVVRFSFAENLDDPSLVFLVWRWHGLERFTVPSMGRTATVGAAPLVLSGALRPRIRARAFEK